MCGTKTTSTDTSNSYDPWVSSAGNTLYNSASGFASANPYSAYSGPTAAAQNGAQTAAMGAAGSMLGNNNANLSSAASGTQGVANSINPNASIADLMNPYAQAALAPTLQNINIQGNQAQATNNENAAMQGAYGGSAAGVQGALMNRDTQQQISNATATGMNTAYNAAQAQQNANTTNALSANSQLANIGSTEQNAQTSIASLLGSLGAQQQGVQQQGITNAMTVNQEQNTGQLGQDATLAGLLSTIPKNTSGTSDTTQPDNSGFALLGSLL